MLAGFKYVLQQQREIALSTLRKISFKCHCPGKHQIPAGFKHYTYSQTGQDFTVRFTAVPLRYYSQGELMEFKLPVFKKSTRKLLFKETILTDALNFIKIHPSIQAGLGTLCSSHASSPLMGTPRALSRAGNPEHAGHSKLSSL